MTRASFVAVSTLIVVGLLITSAAVGGPYLRSLQLDEEIRITALPTTYDCGDGSCIALTVQTVNGKDYSDYINKQLIPYSATLDNAQLENQLTEFLLPAPRPLCAMGHLHRFPVNTLRLFQAPHGSYRFEIKAFTEGECAH